MNRACEHALGSRLIAELWTSFRVGNSLTFISQTPDNLATQVSIDTTSRSRTRKARSLMNGTTEAVRQPTILSMSCSATLTVTSTTSQGIDIPLQVLRLEFGVRR